MPRSDDDEDYQEEDDTEEEFNEDHISFALPRPRGSRGMDEETGEACIFESQPRVGSAPTLPDSVTFN